MINLMKYTYLMQVEKIDEELSNLWARYKNIIDNPISTWEEINEARAILFLTGNIYCETIAVDAIKRRLNLLQSKLSLIDFLVLIDTDSDKLEELRTDMLFVELERYYRIIKEYKNRYISGKYYLEEERFLEKYNKLNPKEFLTISYSGSFSDKLSEDEDERKKFAPEKEGVA